MNRRVSRLLPIAGPCRRVLFARSNSRANRLITNSDANAVSVIDTATNTVNARFPSAASQAARR
jgi:hypothetical protein